MITDYIRIKEEVREALENNRPVVALESTIITHGMPYPENLQTAQEVEEIIRNEGAVPATIAVLDGIIHVGLSNDELVRLANEKEVVKLSRRDLPIAISKKLHGSTTVACTMICANLAGIKFFVTGGIGGVHRGYEQTMDVSSDLDEFVRTPVNVICAGAKAILDLPRTMEYLETKGILAIGYQTEELPAFFSRKSGIKLHWTCNSAQEIADVVKVKETLKLGGGILITNPIPEKNSFPEDEIGNYIDQALAEASQNNIHGKETTPFLLKTIVEKTKGRSLESNIALIKNNAELGAKIAVSYYNK